MSVYTTLTDVTDLPAPLHRPAPLKLAIITAIVLAGATLLTGCDNPPQLAESERQYCPILDQLSRDIGDNASAHDSNNALQREESEKAEIQLFQKFNATLHGFFVTHTTLDKWAVKLDTERGVELNNDIVQITFTTTCSDTPLITAVSRRDTGVISVLKSAKTSSYAVVSGSLRQIGYRDSFSVWGWEKPIYITFLMRSIFAVNEDGAIRSEEKSTYSSDLSTTRAIDAAAANEYTRDGDRQHEYTLKSLQKAYDAIRR
jgi:hypothetical protein